MKNIYRSIISIGSLGIMAAPIAATVSCSWTDVKIDRQTFNQYGELSTSVISTQRSFDSNFSSGNVFTSNDLSSTSRVLPLMRTHVSGKDVPEYIRDTKTGDVTIKFSETQTKEIKFDGAESLTVNGTTYTDQNLDLLPSDLGSDVVTFNIDTSVKYIDYKNNPTQYNLIGKDFLYGMIRTLYSNLQLRVNGKINGKDSSGYLPKFSESDLKMLLEVDGSGIQAMNNNNAYLFDLFDIDIKGTLDENAQARDNEFKVKFTKNANKAAILGFIANSSTFSPQSSQLIDKMAQEWAQNNNKNLDKNPGIKYGISNYGGNKINGYEVTGYKDIISVTPYVFTKFDLLDKYELVKNMHFKDKDWVKNNKTLNKIVWHILPPGDENARILQRVYNYKKGFETMLDTKVIESPQFEQFKADPKKSGYTHMKIAKTGIGSKLGWDASINPTNIQDNNGNDGFNELGLKMMYGDNATKGNVMTSIEALDEFYNGNGQKLRGFINNIVNQYALTQESTSIAGKTSLRGLLNPEQALWSPEETAGKFQDVADSNPNFIFNRPTHSATQKELEDQYNKNSSLIEKYKTSPKAYAYWSQVINDLTTKVGATPSNQAQVPISFWEVSDSPTLPLINSLYENILKTLNSVSDNVRFVKAKALDNSSFLEGIQSGRETMMHYIGWGEDYPLSNSLYQGVYGIATGLGFNFGAIYHDFVSDTANPFLPEVKNKIKNEFPSMFPTLAGKTTDELKTIFSKIGIKDIRKIATQTPKDYKIPNEQKELLLEIENIVTKPFYAVSTNENAVRNIAKYYEDHAAWYGLSPKTATITRRIGGVAAAAIVKKPWLTPAWSALGTYLPQDYRVDN